jgi:extracellular elastinolytic metalloproteinase
MSHVVTPARRRAMLAVASVAALAVAGLAGTTSYAASTGGAHAEDRSPRSSGGAQRDPLGYYDAQTDAPGAAVAAAKRASRTMDSRSVRQFAASGTGDEKILDIDGTTGTVRELTRLNGFLTGPSSKSPKSIALGYVRQHAAELGLVAADLKTFSLHRNYRDIAGTHHLYFTQRIAGSPVLQNGLTASVTRSGHLLTVGGSPVSTQGLAAAIPSAASASKVDSSSEALAAARQDTGTSTSTDGTQDSATSGLFVTPTGVHRAWQTVVMSSQTPVVDVIDARTGAVLFQHPLTDYETGGDSTGRVYHFYPGAAHGGRQTFVDFTKHGWLPRGAHVLKGNNAHAFSDVNDDNRPEASEQVHPLTGHSFGYKLQPFKLKWARSFCGKIGPCSWNPDKRFSWRTNRAQNTAQVFFYVNNWHDHLMKAPIGFTAAAGNFQMKNHGKAGKGGDPVNTQTDDGANTAHGLPDGAHIDNANMSTPPDGHSPRMQMYLQHAPHTSYPGGDPWSPTNVGDEADTVYHEYTHGLSNRLNVDVQGASTLGDVQAGAMGEAWSDWYAMDYLVDKHLQRDKRGTADVRMFRYDGDGVNFDRTEPMDCQVGQKVRLCNGGDTGHRGGYTYADYGKVVGGPEVHADGEIWAQTLWSLRYKLGSKHTEALVTRAMELAPYNPSFLDMRNAILDADTALFHGSHRATIWKVFASRGMGFYAGSLGGNDPKPGADFHVPPPTTIHTADLSGTVTDSVTHLPVPGVPVTLAFQGSGAVNPTAVTDTSGHYVIHHVPVGTYAKLTVQGKGYSATRKATVGRGGGTANFTDIPKDWAARSAGGSIVRNQTTGRQFPGCNANQAIDLDQGTAASTNISPGTSLALGGTFTPKHFVVKLPQVITVTSFGVNPSAGCGDGASASTSGYKIETSPNGTTWTTERTGTFTSADDGRVNQLALGTAVPGVRYVRFTMESNQVPAPFSSSCPSGGFSGCAFVDLTEFEVFGN